MYQALYRKWRPTLFDDVVGQEQVTSILKNEVSSGKISHAYLFCGPRGTGKTTCAKIIAKAVNCEHPVNGNPCGECTACRAIEIGSTTDIIEMDAASNNGVDNIRELRDGVIYAPADLRYRVYIIDEVHMLSLQAFNALLKTLEEPPKHAIFILATTELHKIPATVLSRCQRFDFHRVSMNAIVGRLAKVCGGEGIQADNTALDIIARLSQGGMRDALNMLEYCAGEGGTVSVERTEQLLGTSSRAQLFAVAEALSGKDTARALAVMDDVYLSSRDMAVFWRELIAFFRDLMIAVSTRITDTADAEVRRAASLFSLPALLYILNKMIDAESDMQKNPSGARLYAEMALIRACDSTLSVGTDALYERVSALEGRLSGGVLVSPISDDSKTKNATEPPHIKDKTEPEKMSKKAESQENTPNKNMNEGKVATRRSVRKWQEIVRRLTGTEQLLVPFLQVASAFEETDGRFTICFESDFAVTLMTDTRRNVLCSAINTVLGTSYKPTDITTDVRKDTGGIREPIEDLLESVGTESEQN